MAYCFIKSTEYISREWIYTVGIYSVFFLSSYLWKGILFDYIRFLQKSWEKEVFHTTVKGSSAPILLEVLNGGYIATFQMDSDWCYIYHVHFSITHQIPYATLFRNICWMHTIARNPQEPTLYSKSDPVQKDFWITSKMDNFTLTSMALGMSEKPTWKSKCSVIVHSFFFWKDHPKLSSESQKFPQF